MINGDTDTGRKKDASLTTEERMALSDAELKVLQGALVLTRDARQRENENARRSTGRTPYLSGHYGRASILINRLSMERVSRRLEGAKRRLENARQYLETQNASRDAPPAPSFLDTLKRHIRTYRLRPDKQAAEPEPAEAPPSSFQDAVELSDADVALLLDALIFIHVLTAPREGNDNTALLTASRVDPEIAAVIANEKGDLQGALAAIGPLLARFRDEAAQRKMPHKTLQQF